MILAFLNNDPCRLVACISLWQTLTTLLSWCLIIHQLLVNQFSAVPRVRKLFLITFVITSCLLNSGNGIFGGPFWLNVCPIGIMGQKSSLPCSCLPGVYHGNLLKLAPKSKHQKNSQALYAWPAFCIIYIYMGVSKNRGTPKWMVYNGKPYWNGWFGGTIIFGNIHIVLTNMACWLNHHLIWYYSLTHLHSMFSATTFVPNMAAKRWKIASNPHYQTPAFPQLSKYLHHLTR